LWSVEDVTIRGRKQRRIGNRGSWGRCSCVTYGAEAARKHRTGETEKWRAEEWKG